MPVKWKQPLSRELNEKEETRMKWNEDKEICALRDITTFQQTIVCSFKQIREYKCLFTQLSSILFFSWYCLPFLSLDSDSKEFVFVGEKRDILIKCGERMERKIASFRFDSGIYIYLFIATFEYSSLGCRTHTNTQPHTHKPSVYGNIYSIW